MGNKKGKKSSSKLVRENPEQFSEFFIGPFQHADQFNRDNTAITHGYRINFNSPSKILKSMFMIHNQTGNIWTHFLPACIILGFVLYFTFFVSHYSLAAQLQTHHRQFHHDINSFLSNLQNATLLRKPNDVQAFGQMQMAEFQKSALFTLDHLEREVIQSGNNLVTTIKKTTSKVQDQLFQQLNQKIAALGNIKSKVQHKIEFLNGSIQQKVSEIDTIEDQVMLINQQLSNHTTQIMQSLSLKENTHLVSRWPLVGFLICAGICLFCSTIFHLFNPMSPEWYPFFLRVDYAGISIIMAGCSFPYIYYTLYCDIETAMFYITLTSVFGAGMFLLALTEWIHRPQKRVTKTVIYAVYAAHYLIPFFHMLGRTLFFNNHGDSFNFLNTVPYILCIWGSDGFGALIYASRCPEKRNPGKYNLCGHSHQLWHLFVVLGVIFSYLGAILSFQQRKQAVCPI